MELLVKALVQAVPLLDEDEKVCDAILRMSTASNGKLADRAWEKKQERTGEHLTDWSWPC